MDTSQIDLIMNKIEKRGEWTDIFCMHYILIGWKYLYWYVKDLM